MRKLIIALFFLIRFVVAGTAQDFQIACLNGFNNNNTFCCGYTKANQASIGIVKFPKFIPPDNAGVVYTWFASHDQGPKFWETPVPSRMVPLPWSGSYQVFVMVYFVDKTSLRRIAAYRSNTITVRALACEENKEAGQH